METEPKISILGHQHNEEVIYTKPETGFTAKFQWDGEREGYIGPLAKGFRIAKDIISIVQAIVTARQISKNGASNKIGSWIEPCTVLEEGRLVHCPFRDLTAQTFCKHPEGPPIPQDGKLECPAQKGPIRHIEHLTNT